MCPREENDKSKYLLMNCKIFFILAGHEAKKFRTFGKEFSAAAELSKVISLSPEEAFGNLLPRINDLLLSFGKSERFFETPKGTFSAEFSKLNSTCREDPSGEKYFLTKTVFCLYWKLTRKSSDFWRIISAGW